MTHVPPQQPVTPTKRELAFLRQVADGTADAMTERGARLLRSARQKDWVLNGKLTSMGRRAVANGEVR